MIGRGSLALCLSAWLVACHPQTQDRTPAQGEVTPCNGTDCTKAGQEPPSEPEEPERRDDSGDVSADTDQPNTVVDCSTLEQNDCDASDQCVTITDTGGVYRGCGPRDVGCKEVETCASKGEVTTLFPDSCIPEGYMAKPTAACETASE